MPIISMFYGIIIRMYLIDNQHHNLPHIHSKYAEFEASIGIESGEFLRVSYPENSSDWCRPGLSCTATN